MPSPQSGWLRRLRDVPAQERALAAASRRARARTIHVRMSTGCRPSGGCCTPPSDSESESEGTPSESELEPEASRSRALGWRTYTAALKRRKDACRASVLAELDAAGQDETFSEDLFSAVWRCVSGPGVPASRAFDRQAVRRSLFRIRPGAPLFLFFYPPPLSDALLIDLKPSPERAAPSAPEPAAQRAAPPEQPLTPVSSDSEPEAPPRAGRGYPWLHRNSEDEHAAEEDYALSPRFDYGGIFASEDLAQAMADSLEQYERDCAARQVHQQMMDRLSAEAAGKQSPAESGVKPVPSAVSGDKPEATQAQPAQVSASQRDPCVFCFSAESAARACPACARCLSCAACASDPRVRLLEKCPLCRAVLPVLPAPASKKQQKVLYTPLRL